jgi:hypothetical protein
LKKIFMCRHDVTCRLCPHTLPRDSNAFEGFPRGWWCRQDGQG